MSASAHSRSALGAFFRASSLHIGAAAATASLREELVRGHGLRPGGVDAAYAVSRVTPGTNLLALYALLGHRLGGWRLALQAIALGSLVPASVAVLVTFLYSRSTSPIIADVMAWARAGGVVVFLGAAIRLLRPQLTSHSRIGPAFALSALLSAWFLPLNLFAVLVIRRHGGRHLASPSMTALALYWLFLRVVLLSFSGFATVIITGVRLAAQATLTPWHGAVIVVGTLVLALTKIKPAWIIAVAAVLGLVLR